MAISYLHLRICGRRGVDLAIFVETNKKLHLCTDGIVVCPIHPQIDSMSNYPITSIRDYYPLEYSHMMHIVKEGVGKGDVIYSDIDGHQKILWVCCDNAYNVAYKLDWIEDGLKSMAAMKLTDKGTVYFPGIGYYQEDGVDQESVLKLVYKYLNNGRFNVSFLTHY